jgi:hypothetical protein
MKRLKFNANALSIIDAHNKHSFNAGNTKALRVYMLKVYESIYN